MSEIFTASTYFFTALTVIVFALADPQNIVRVVLGEDIGTKVN